MLPRITVVTPAYKAERLIEATLSSVLDQRYPNLEYIVLDGAGDRTAEILQRHDADLAHWRSHPDGGQYEAINEGFARATGEILCWLNADDMLLPRALFVVAEIMAKFPDVQWLSTLRPGHWDANGYLASIRETPGFAREAFLDGLFLPDKPGDGFWIQQESTFFRRSLWEKAGARIPNYALAGDFALWCEFYKHADLIGVEYPLAGFRHIAGQRSEAIDEYLHQGRQALADLRAHVGWSPLKAKLRTSPLAKLPKIRRLTQRMLGYKGRSVRNADIRNLGAIWTLQDYAFLP